MTCGDVSPSCQLLMFNCDLNPAEEHYYSDVLRSRSVCILSDALFILTTNCLIKELFLMFFRHFIFPDVRQKKGSTFPYCNILLVPQKLEYRYYTFL